MNRCFGSETILPTSIPEKVHSHSKHKFCVFLHSVGFRNAPNHPNQHFGSNAVEWMLWLRFFAYETMFATSVPEMVHSGMKHMFFIFLHSVHFKNAPKTLPNNILGPMQMNGCFGYKTIFATSVPQNSIHARNTSFHLFTFRRFPKCSENTPKQHFRSNGDERMLWL
jgi:hypothetical protein